MSVSGVGSSAAANYAAQAPPAMKGEAVRAAAQVMVARKVLDTHGEIHKTLIASVTDLGRQIDIKA